MRPVHGVSGKNGLHDERVTMDFFERYFDDAVRIYAICGDENLSDDEARLATYLHVKITENNGSTCFLSDPEAPDAEALEVMLGETVMADTYLLKNGNLLSIPADAASSGDAVRSLDERCRTDHGMENRISGELRGRLRLYRDEAFRNSMVSLYEQKIAPRLHSYDRTAVERAFEAFREKTACREQELLDD